MTSNLWTSRGAEVTQTAVELCCGMGGIGLGLAASGYRVIKAYDSWSDAVAVYNHNAPEPVASTCNILSNDGRAMIKRERRSLGDVEILAAGPPCKGFSQIRNGHHTTPNPHNRVLLAIPEYVAVFRPRLVLIENVPDLARHREGATLRKILWDIERPGPRGLRYRVEHRVYDAAVFGTPQARRRILILAVRVGSGNERLPDQPPDMAPLFAAIRHGGKIPRGMQRFADCLADPHDISMTTAHQALSDIPLLTCRRAGGIEALRFAATQQLSEDNASRVPGASEQYAYSGGTRRDCPSAGHDLAGRVCPEHP